MERSTGVDGEKHRDRWGGALGLMGRSTEVVAKECWDRWGGTFYINK